MQRIVIFSFIVGLFFSCATPIQEADLVKLNGFWEIEKVVLPNKDVKEYKVNEEMEQIEFKEGKGTRRKVIMLYNGNFLTNNITQEFTIETKNDECFLLNKTDYATWKEEIVELSDAILSIKNEEGILYHYRKRNDIKLEKNGEKN